MKRGRPPSGCGSSRNSDYYVKKFRPSKNGGRNIMNYFKSASGNSNEIDIKDNSSPIDNKGTKEKASVLGFDECISEDSNSNDTEISLSINTRDSIDEIENSSPTKTIEETIENTSLLRFDESTSHPTTSCNIKMCLSTEKENEIKSKRDHSLKIINEEINQKNSSVLLNTLENEFDSNIEVKNIEESKHAIDQKYITIYEKAYNWLYYSHSAGGFLCKQCSLMNNSESDKPWETIGVDIKKNGHPNRVCKKHEISKRHRQTVIAQEVSQKKGIMKSISEGAESSNTSKVNFNRKLISKFIQILYFMIKKQWAVSENFESLVRFLGENLEDEEIKKHLESCNKNATYLSHISVQTIVNSISTFLERDLLTKLACADFFALMADECTDESQREQLGLIVRYRLPGDSSVQEKYFGLINLRNSTAEAITSAIERICIAKNIDISKCLFIALDGANVMSGEHSGVQRRIKHLSPHCSYINCRNHKLALVFVHLLKKHKYLKAVDSLLISLWKLFHYSPKKTAVFNEIQKNVYCIDVLKVMKVSTTRWLSHGRACERVSSRYEQLLEALDSIFVETCEPELKGMREQLLEPKIILTILFLADFLGKVDVLNLWLQSPDISFNLVNSKVANLINEVESYCENLENGNCFQKSKDLLNLANECTTLSKKLRGKSQSTDFLIKFKEEFVKTFLNDFKKELSLAFDLSSTNSCNLKGFDTFSDIHINGLTDDDEQSDFNSCLSLLISFYGEEKKDVFQEVVTISNPIINKISIETEKNDFKKEMLLVKMNFDINKTKTAQQLLHENRKDDAKKAMEKKINSNDLQMILERESKNWILYPNFMKLLSLCTIMPTSTSSVERLFSRMNLLCTDLRTSLKQENLDRQLRIIINGPKSLSQNQCEEIVDIFKMTGNRRLVL